MNVLPKGVRHLPGFLDRAAQQALVEEIRAVVAAAPLYRPQMPRTGKPFSVRMTNCGDLGWVADRTGYRYQPLHPETGKPWPAIPETLLDLWRGTSAYPHLPEACLVNFYDETARLGLHQDRDEADLDAPVVSVSLGDACLFRIGGPVKGGRTTSLKLVSGDVLVLGGEGRLAFHGVDRLYPGTSALLRKGGRINLTLRRVTRPMAL
ncbi:MULTISPECIES: alpha-ketoglutarate-dependent dioxygenase AlkB family protein [unclassified Aureimonas]|uniref:alpha-ketoglutarate-dependent dioxygenase AlkB family protein n=1 Tax=unclassified Aureimonas TaxID=2615206 RepID=UPI0006F6C9F4|nr:MULTISPECIES: alpha-ketoglutarate-dependent dioxygenase AlkB [unclassified Aureimonas]KQT52564.1 alkylated DNA repair dioxygenase [Aureimonas sp. Leaf427]KQT77535.1 alkylated DNA repair dioxygenase [Aureimonas sp. Leaf460]